MALFYTEERNFRREQVEALFQKTGWDSARYPNRVFQALQHSSTVITCWDGERLVGLIRALDDGAIVAFLHWLMVDPDYRGRGIARALVERMKEKYADYLFLNMMPDEDKNVKIYEKMGFTVFPEGAPLSITNLDIRDREG